MTQWIIINHVFSVFYIYNIFQDIYPVKSANRGRAVIINNHIFPNPKDNRDGTEFDKINLKELFHQLHFTTVIHNDLSKKVSYSSSYTSPL